MHAILHDVTLLCFVIDSIKVFDVTIFVYVVVLTWKIVAFSFIRLDNA